MRKIYLLLLFLNVYIFCSAQERLTPAVPGHGGIFKIDNPDETPDPALTYKIVIDITMGSDSAIAVNPALHNIARMFNLHVAAGVPIENMDIVAVIHNKATSSLLNDKAYKRLYHVENPNNELIAALTKAGVKLFVCGQSLLARGYDRKEINKHIGVSVSALTIQTEYQLKGYALLKF
jgi:intracellular sulfur oxidation DsrE/DsrF family protein